MTKHTENQLEGLKKFGYQFKMNLELENIIFTQLKNKGFIRKKSGAKRFLVPVFLIVSFLLGFFIQSPSFKPVSKPKSLYAVFVYEDENFEYTDPEEMAREYSGWLDKTAKSRKFIDGYELDYSEHTLSPDSLVSSYGLLTGVFVFDAKSVDEVKNLVKNHPHLKHHGQMTIRKIIQR